MYAPEEVEVWIKLAKILLPDNFDHSELIIQFNTQTMKKHSQK